MKRHAQALLVVGLLLSLSSAVMAYSGGTYVPGSGINGTVHDLATFHNGMNYIASPADDLQRICIFCHAPHNTYKTKGITVGGGVEAPSDKFDYLPLWNHTLQSDVGYTMYTNGTGGPDMGAKASQAMALGMTPGSTSLLCLSCHDGSVAVNSYGNGESTGTAYISPSYVIGKDKYLGNHHPIGFDYDAVQTADVEIRPADTFMTSTTTIRDHLLGSGNTRMECGTCHSVHNKGNTGETLLWRSDRNSELCLTCHAKGIYTAQ